MGFMQAPPLAGADKAAATILVAFLCCGALCTGLQPASSLATLPIALEERSLRPDDRVAAICSIDARR